MKLNNNDRKAIFLKFQIPTLHPPRWFLSLAQASLPNWCLWLSKSGEWGNAAFLTSIPGDSSHIKNWGPFFKVLINYMLLWQNSPLIFNFRMFIHSARWPLQSWDPSRRLRQICDVPQSLSQGEGQEPRWVAEVLGDTPRVVAFLPAPSQPCCSLLSTAHRLHTGSTGWNPLLLIFLSSYSS